MLIILHHVNQHRLGDLGFVVGFSVSIEVTEPGTFECADLAVEGFQALMNIPMFLQLLPGVELLLALLALLRLDPLGVLPIDVAVKVLPAAEDCPTVAAGKLSVGVVPLGVKNEITFTIEGFSTLSTQMTLGSFLVGLLDVIVPGDPTLETLPTHFAGHCIHMASMNLHRVELQGSVGEEVFATAGADVLHH